MLGLLFALAAPGVLAQAPDVSATKTDSFPDPDTDGKAVPGATITYTVEIQNGAGAGTATGVQLTDPTPQNTTLVPGSLRMTPLARNDTYSAAPGQPITATAATGVLANDSGIPAPTAVPFSGTTTGGGTLTLNADGSFSYTPASGFSGTDTFTYTITNTVTPDDTAILSLSYNAAPVVTPTNGSTAYTEGAGAVTIDPGITVTDSDDTHLESARIAITSGFQAGDELNLGSTATITAAYNSGTGVLTLTGHDTTANYELAFRSVAFDSTNDTPVASKTIEFKVNDGDVDSNTPTKEITVTGTNDPPSFTPGGDITVPEDAGSVIAPNWATNRSQGPSDESGQALTFTATVTGTTGTLTFQTSPAVNPNTGTLTFTANANTCGTATVDITLTDDGGTPGVPGDDLSSPTHTLNLIIQCVNDAPSFTKGADQTVNEDAAAQTVNPWATGISPGPGETDALTFNVSNDNNALFTAGGQPAVSPAGVLTYTPAANANGSTTVTVSLTDDAGTPGVPGDDLTSASQTFTITLNAVNDQPTLDVIADQTVLEDSGSSNVSLTGISSGPVNESGQGLTITASSSDTAIVPHPTVGAVSGGGATLTFAPAANRFGMVTITVTVTDDGGTAGVPADDQSFARNFPITVTGVNDPPTFIAGANVTVNEDSAPYSAGWATSINSGPNETGQTVSFGVTNNNNALFMAGAGQPAIASNGTLTFTPALNAFGSATVTVAASDNGGIANSGDNTADNVTFTITVNAVNDPPVADADGWDFIGNTVLEVDAAQDFSPAPSVHVSSSVLVGDTDPVENDPISVTGVVGSADASAPYTGATANGGSLTIGTDGRFVYQPRAGDTAGTDSFQYVLTDSPAAGSPASANGTVTLTRMGRVWYVNNSAAADGNGISSAPFDTLAEADTASVDGDTIYVFRGDGTTTGQNNGISLSSNQRLIGQGVALTVPVSVNGGSNPHQLLGAGSQPFISHIAGNGVTVGNATGVEIRGLNISATTSAINLTSTSGNASLTVHNNAISGSGALNAGIDINANSTGTTTVDVQNNTISGSGNGFDAATGAVGTLNIVFSNNTNITSTSVSANGIVISGAFSGSIANITAFSGNQVSGNTVGGGMSITSAVFDATPGGSYNGVSGGDTDIGESGNAVGGTGISLSNVRGDLSFTDLDIFAGSGVALSATSTAAFNAGSATGLRITVPNGFGTLSASGGAALSATLVLLDLQNIAITSSGSTSHGVNLENTDGSTFSSTAGSTISMSNAAATAFRVANSDTGTSTYTYNGTITTSGSKGVDLATNTGSTVSFTNDLIISSGTGTAFNATGGGTVTCTDTASTLTTTTGIALNVANTTIGNDDLTFRSISASDPSTSGIILNNTVNAGGRLVVSGNGGTCTSVASCTGGAIQGAGGSGISLTNVPGGVSLTRMIITGSVVDGINGVTVGSGVTLDNVAVTSNGTNAAAPGGGAHGDNGVDFTSLTGTSAFTNCNVSNNRDSNVVVTNASGTCTLNVTGGTYSGATTGGQADGIFMEASGTGSHNLNVQSATFSHNLGDHVQHGTTPASTSNNTVIINNATMSSPPAPGGGPAGGGGVLAGGITVVAGGPPNTGGSTTKTAITNNNIQNSVIGAIAIGTTGSVGDQQTGNVHATITGNTIGNPAVAGSGSVQGNAIFVDSNGNGNVRVLIQNNTTHQWTNRSGIFLDVIDGDAQMSATVKDNEMSTPNSAFAGTSTRGMTLQLGTLQAGDSVDVCLDIGDPSTALKNQVAGTGESPQPDVRYLHEGPGSIVQLVGYSGPSAPSITDIANWFQPRNNIAGTPTVTGVGSSPGTTTSSIGSCEQPQTASPPLLFAPRPAEVNGTSEQAALKSSLLPRRPLLPAALAAITMMPNVVAAHTTFASADERSLTQTTLQATASAAVAAWESSGLTSEQLTILRSLKFMVARLPDSRLGEADGNQIRIDVDAAGNGWAVDQTPADGGVDLLTTLMHEIGHVLGLPDSYDPDDRESVMYGFLTKGERRLPKHGEAAVVAGDAVPGRSVATSTLTGDSVPGYSRGPQYLSSPVDIGDIPAGKTVKITFEVQINDPVPANTTEISSQGTVSGGNFTNKLTDDPSVGGASDPTLTPVLQANAATVYVDDNWSAVPIGADPDGAGPATSFGYDAFHTVQNGVNGVAVNGSVMVAAATYNEDVAVNRAGISVLGAGAGTTTVSGPIGGDGATFRVTASGVTIAGFTITRAGNNTTDWNNPNLNNVGVAVQGTIVTGMVLRDNVFTGNRTAIDINNSNGHTVRNNVIDFNRAGFILRNQTDNLTVVENFITNNWTQAFVFLDASGGTNSPMQTAANSVFANNNISGNWYGSVVDRQSGGALPAPGTTNLKDFSGNWFGTTTPVITTANTSEPGYAAQIPVAYGGTATPPGGQPDIAGPASANVDLTPYLAVGTDTNVETVSGRGTSGFQGDFSSVYTTTFGPEIGSASRIDEAITLVTAGGTVRILGGSYTGGADASAKSVVLSPGASPALVALTGNLVLSSDDTLVMELNGPTLGTQYDNINVTGTVTLNGATLQLSGGYPTSFTLISNDGSDAIAGAFAGLPEGTPLTINGLPYKITYAGLSGNDLVLALQPPTTVYVDDSWAANAIGDDPDGVGGPATSFGYDAFATIQNGFNAVATSGTVNVRAGTYTERVVVSKAVSLLGPNANINPNTGVRVAEAVIIPTASDPINPGFGGPIVIQLTTSGVTVNGFTVDGDNPALTSGVVYNGSDVDAEFGIYGDNAANLDAVITNNIVKNIGEMGIWLNTFGIGGARNANSLISVNKVDNVLGNFGQGIRISDDAWVDITNNAVSRARVGITIENFSGNVTSHPASVISGNNISAFRIGIRHNLHFNYAAPGFAISQNTVSAYVQNPMPPQVTSPSAYQGIRVEDIRNSVAVTVSNNTLTGNNAAMSAGGYTRNEGLNVTTTSTVSPNIVFTGNSISGFLEGVRHETPAVPTFTSNTITGNTTGIRLIGGAGAANNGLIAHFNRIVGNTTGLRNEGTGAVNAENNFFGCNGGPGAAGCDTISNTSSGSIDANPWLVLKVAATPTRINTGTTSAVTADLRFNSDSVDTSALGSVPGGISVDFSATLGTVSPDPVTLTNGTATTTFTAGNTAGNGSVTADVDNAEPSVAIVVNGAPLAGDDNATTNEDAATTVNVLTNDSDPNGDTVTVSDVTQGANGAVTITNAGTTVTYTPNANFNGSDTFTYRLSDGLAQSAFATVSVTVNGLNDAPTLDTIPDPAAIAEDAAQQTVNLTGISAGGGESQTLTVTAASSDTTIVPHPTVTYTSPNATGSLSYAPIANASGSALITVTVTDNGATGGSNVNTFQRTFTVNVTAVNDAPTLDAIPDPAAIPEESGAQTVNLSGISAGGGETQTLTVTASSSDPTIVPAPTVTYTSPNTTGSLSYTPAANASGSAIITVTVTDNGATGGSNLNTFQRTFTVNVTAVNDAPTFTKGANQTVNEDAGAQTVNAWATNISAGPNEAAQTLNFLASNDNNALFASQPAVGSDGTLNYTPAANANGSAVVTVTLKDDGGTANGGQDTSAPQTFTITVAAVNDAPVNNVPGNQNVIENSAVGFSNANGNAVSISDLDAGSNPIQVTLTANNGTITLSGTAGLTFTLGDGSADPTMTFTGTTANINAALDGMSFAPNQGFDGAAALQVTTDDQGNTGGGALNDTDTVSIVVADGGVLSFASATYTVGEEDGTVTVTVTRSAGTAGEARVNYATSNGSAVAGSDYTATSGTLVFANGVTSQTFAVTMTGDSVNEAEESFDLTLSAPAGTGALGSPVTATVTIADNDAPATPTPTATPSPTATPTATPTGTPSARPVNISTRARVGTGDNVMIAGTIIRGNVPKRIIVRAIGPSLAQAGIEDALADPILRLHGPDGSIILSNDDWRDGREADIEATGLAPTDDRESAILLAALPPSGYTAVIVGKDDTVGLALAEIYDLDPDADSRLANISTRGLVETGESVIIGGFMLGASSTDGNVIVRGLGPSLAGAGVVNTLVDPTLELRDANGVLIRANDNWQEDPAQAAAITASGIPPTNPLESAIAASLPPGDYTAILAGKNGTSGIGLVEIYNAP